MIQLQAINNILSANNLEAYLGANININHFYEYADEYTYILSHFNKYNKVPDLATFLVHFTDFDVVEVLEPVSYIIENLKEEYLYKEGVKVFQRSADLLKQNSYEGLTNILIQAEKLLESNSQREIHNINDMVSERIVDIETKKERGGMVGISSGMPELDRILGGWLPGQELVVIVGRVNQGKSWLLQKFMAEANKQSKTCLLYSGEMGVMQVAYRNDTLSDNYSNTQLVRGTITDLEFESYKEDLARKKDTASPYYVVTPKYFGGRWATVSDLKMLIKKYKPDIVGIDQLSLMTDERGGESKRIQMGNITMDLFNLTEEFGIPIIADAQANRNKADVENPENPELADVAESDAIGQNASRVISLVQTKLGLSLKITKNRHGSNNKKLIYSWDIDSGIFRFVESEEQRDNNQLPFKNNKTNNNSITSVF